MRSGAKTKQKRNQLDGDAGAQGKKYSCLFSVIILISVAIIINGIIFIIVIII